MCFIPKANQKRYRLRLIILVQFSPASGQLLTNEKVSNLHGSHIPSFQVTLTWNGPSASMCGVLFEDEWQHILTSACNYLWNVSVGGFCQAAVSHTCRSHWVVLSQKRVGMRDRNRGSDKDWKCCSLNTKKNKKVPFPPSDDPLFEVYLYNCHIFHCQNWAASRK